MDKKDVVGLEYFNIFLFRFCGLLKFIVTKNKVLDLVLVTERLWVEICDQRPKIKKKINKNTT